MMLLSGTVLPKGIGDKVEAFGAGVPVVRPSPKAEGFAANSSGPLGFRAAGAHFAEPLARTPGATFALLLADRLAARETELLPDSNIMV